MNALAVDNNPQRDWRGKILRKAYADKGLNANSLRLLLYLMSVMRPGELRYVSLEEAFREVGLFPTKGSVSVAFGQLDEGGYIRRIISKANKTKREVELLEPK